MKQEKRKGRRPAKSYDAQRCNRDWCIFVYANIEDAKKCSERHDYEDRLRTNRKKAITGLDALLEEQN